MRDTTTTSPERCLERPSTSYSDPTGKKSPSWSISSGTSEISAIIKFDKEIQNAEKQKSKQLSSQGSEELPKISTIQKTNVSPQKSEQIELPKIPGSVNTSK